jgi:hypothetical protein
VAKETLPLPVFFFMVSLSTGYSLSTLLVEMEELRRNQCSLVYGWLLGCAAEFERKGKGREENEMEIIIFIHPKLGGKNCWKNE